MCGNIIQSGGKVVAALGLIALGMVLLLGVGVFWPLFILAPGLAFLAIAHSGGRGTASFAVPGMIILGTGTLLFFQNLTGYWASWSYAWTLYGVFLGLGIILMGELMDDPSLPKVGRGFVKAGVAAFVVFAFLMELVFNVGGGAWLLPVLLIAAGLVLIARTLAGRGRAKRKVKPKRREEPLFTGPIVYGSRVARPSNGSRRGAAEQDDLPMQPRRQDN
jgi:hypothetical protein